MKWGIITKHDPSDRGETASRGVGVGRRVTVSMSQINHHSREVASGRAGVGHAHAAWWRRAWTRGKTWCSSCCRWRASPGLILLITLLITTAPSEATPYEVAVIYPEAKGHYQKIYSAILQGLSRYPKTRVNPLLLDEGVTPQKLDAWLKERDVRAVITLGVKGYAVTKELHLDLPVITGAVVVSPNGVTGISLAGDPEEFFNRLQELAPQTRRVFIIYSEHNSGWLVAKAEVVAKRRGIQLMAFKAEDAREALRHYTRVLSEVEDGRDAIWLPLDSIIPDETVMPLVLEAAWKHRLVVFSNNPSHAKMGALFSLYPDPEAMGQDLAEMTVERLQPASRPRVEPTRNMKMAWNRRTASHLGLDPPSRERMAVELVYPAE